MRTLVSLSCCFLLSIIPVHAADSQRHYVVLGHGGDSCGQWTHERRLQSDSSASMGTWIVGYITAYNYHVWKGKNVASETDAPGMFAWIDTYCAANPIKGLVDATEALVDALKTGPHPNDR